MHRLPIPASGNGRDGEGGGGKGGGQGAAAVKAEGGREGDADQQRAAGGSSTVVRAVGLIMGCCDQLCTRQPRHVLETTDVLHGSRFSSNVFWQQNTSLLLRTSARETALSLLICKAIHTKGGTAFPIPNNQFQSILSSLTRPTFLGLPGPRWIHRPHACQLGGSMASSCLQYLPTIPLARLMTS